MTIKICRKCQQEKDEKDFDRDRKGRKAICKICRSIYCKKRYQQKKEVIRIKNIDRYTKDKEIILAQKRDYYEIKKEEIKSKRKQRYWDNHHEAKIKAMDANYKLRKLYPERYKKYQQKYLDKNPDYRARYQRERRKNDLKFKLRKNISCQIYHSLRSQKSKRGWQSLVGYSVEQLKSHLQKTMPISYSWNDYLSGKLHIDHKIPVAAFNFSSPDDLDFKRCFSLKNLQLLPAKENMKKSDNLEEPFQPSLSGLHGVIS